MAVALLHDVLALPELGTLKSILSVAVLPVETLVTMLYWTVLAIDPDLLVPPRLTDDPNNPGQVIKESIRLPLSADLAMHAAPAIFLLAVSRIEPEGATRLPFCCAATLCSNSFSPPGWDVSCRRISYSYRRPFQRRCDRRSCLA